MTTHRLAWLILPALLLAGPAVQAADPPAAREELPREATRSVVGREVTGPSGAVVGRIVNLLMDENGQPRAAVLDYGGFLGVGRRRVAVAWRSLKFSPEVVRLDITREQMGAFPDYKDGATVVIAAPPAEPPPTEAPATDTPAVDPPSGDTLSGETPSGATPSGATDAPPAAAPAAN